MVDLEKKMKFLLKKNHKTQAEVCDFIGMTPQNLGKIWKNNDIKMSDLIQISNFFSVPIEYFFSEGLENEPKKTNEDVTFWKKKYYHAKKDVILFKNLLKKS
jgi:transcriptional regulator with XRE-family HTH domain